MVSATGTYRRAPASSSQFSVPQPHLNGGPTYPPNTSEFSSTLGTCLVTLKIIWTTIGLVCPKMKFYCQFIHPQVILDVGDFLPSVEQ